MFKYSQFLHFVPRRGFKSKLPIDVFSKSNKNPAQIARPGTVESKFKMPSAKDDSLFGKLQKLPVVRAIEENFARQNNTDYFSAKVKPLMIKINNQNSKLPYSFKVMCGTVLTGYAFFLAKIMGLRTSLSTFCAHDKRLVEKRIFEKEIMVDPAFANLFQEVLDDMKLDIGLEPLNVYYSDELSVLPVIFFSVSTNSYAQGSLGLPFYASYKDVSEVKLADLKQKKYLPFLNVCVDLAKLNQVNEEDLKALKETLVLSTAAKKFLIASAMQEYVAKLAYIYKDLSSFIPLLVFYISTNKLNTYGNMFQRPFLLRLGVYAIIASGILVYYLIGKYILHLNDLTRFLFARIL